MVLPSECEAGRIWVQQVAENFQSQESGFEDFRNATKAFNTSSTFVQVNGPDLGKTALHAPTRTALATSS